MRETDRIKSALASVAQEWADTRVASPRACLARILHEIDTVVLPRDIEMDNGAGQVLRLTIKSRRLLRVNAPVPRQLGALPGVVDAELTDQAEQMTALAHLMAAFSAHASDLSVRAAEPARPEVLAEVGVSVDQLRSACQAAGYDLGSEARDVLVALKALAEARGLTWVLVEDGARSEASGDGADFQTVLETTLPHLLKTERPVPPHAASWMFGGGEGPRTAITVRGQSCFIAEVPPELIQSWVATCARGSAD